MQVNPLTPTATTHQNTIPLGAPISERDALTRRIARVTTILAFVAIPLIYFSISFPRSLFVIGVLLCMVLLFSAVGRGHFTVRIRAWIVASTYLLLGAVGLATTGPMDVSLPI